MWETRVYLVYRTLVFDEPFKLKIEEFADEADIQGTVFSLPFFINALNSQSIKIENYYVRCALVKDGTIVKEIKPRY